MAYHIQSSFGAGELDPALHERTTFDKYQHGLKTLRNSHIGKTGRVISRGGRLHNIITKNPVTWSAGTFTTPAVATAESSNHKMGTGTIVQVSATTSLPTGLSAATNYYVIYISTDQFGLATSLANAIAGTRINFLTDGVGTLTFTPQESFTGKKSILFSPPFTNKVIEWGHRYVRIHNTSTGTYAEEGHDWTEDDLPYIHFVPTLLHVYIFRYGKPFKKMVIGDLVAFSLIPFVPDLYSRFVTNTGDFLYSPTYKSFAKNGPPTGHSVEYAVTFVTNGQETTLYTIASSTFLLPILNGESNDITFFGVSDPNVTEMRVYRRPIQGNAFGFIGSTPVTFATDTTFRDIGADADYTHSPPSFDFTAHLDTGPRTGCVYQQRLLTTEYENQEAIHASRTGYQLNFIRDYPLADDSALTFKAGTTGYARVLRLLDNGGLLAFTTAGIFQSVGALTPTNLAMEKKGNWVIEETVPPLEVPGGILFVDKATNTVRTLVYSNEAGGYPGEEVSIFSNHLFLNRKIVSWAFQDGDIPLIWVVFDDGDLISLTYQREHQMSAWSRHDCEGTVESVTVVKDVSENAVPYFLIKRGDERYVEKGTPRFFSDIKDFVGMDAAVTFKSNLASGGAIIDVVANDITDWEGLLTITSDVAVFANTADNGAVGTIFRFFDSQGSAVDLEVVTYNSTTSVVVQPSVEFPSNEGEEVDLYKTYSHLTGLDHLNGKFVSLMVDGYVVASPLNNIENYPELMVVGGQLDIPNGKRGAFVHVGLPFAADVETLDIDTTEQKPTLLESRIINKLYMKVYNTRGLYVGSEFPENDRVEGMTDVDEMTEDINLGIVGNACEKPITKRKELSIPNDWKTNGRVCLRQVDPLPFEILSIIPDISVLI